MYSYDQPGLPENLKKIIRRKGALKHLVNKHISSLHNASSKLKGDTPIGDIINLPHADAIRALENTIDELYQTKSKLNTYSCKNALTDDDFNLLLKKSLDYFYNGYKFPYIIKAAQALRNNNPDAAVEAIWDDIKSESQMYL